MLAPLVRIAATSCAFALFASAAVAGNQLVVGPAGTAPFADIESAVQAAADGDVIVVKPGNYFGFYVQDKALSIVAELPNTVNVTGASRVVFLAAGKTVQVHGLAFRGIKGAQFPQFAGYAFLAIGNAGAVRFQDCSFEGASHQTVPCMSFAPGGWDAVIVEQSTSVSFVDSKFRGGFGAGFNITDWCFPATAGDGGVGLRVKQSNVTVFGGEVLGGRGGAGSTSGHGGAGIRHESGSLIVTATLVMGGDGLPHIDALGFGTHGVPGPGVSASAPWSRQGSEILGGTSPYPGSPWHGLTPTTWVNHGRSLWTTPLVTSGGAITVRSNGVTGDAVLLLLGQGHSHALLPQHGGVLLVAPFDAIPLGSVPAGFPQALVQSFPVGALPPGFAWTLTSQTAHLSAAGPVWLSNVHHSTVRSAP
jgi:hypothetical protein